MRKNIKNYTSKDPVNRVTAKIQEILIKAGAKKIMLDYDAVGNINSITFGLQIEGKGFVPFILPVSVEKLAVVMYDQRFNSLSQKDKDQAMRTAWKNVHDWIDAQMALVETEMVKAEQIFLPYMQTGLNETLFDRFESGNLLPKGD